MLQQLQTGLFGNKLAKSGSAALREILLGQDVGHTNVGIEEIIALGLHDLLQILVENRLTLSGIEHAFKTCEYQDASFQQYGFGATMVIIH